MTEERTLVANLVPEIDETTLNELVNQLKSDMSFTSEIVIQANSAMQESNVNLGDSTDITNTVNEVMQETSEAVSDAMEAIQESTEELADSLSDVMDETVENTSDVTDQLSDLTDVVGDGNANQKKFGESVMSGLGTIADIGVGALRSILDIAQGIWKRLVDSSPLLRETMGLINNAINLILMPVGTAIAVEMIPLVVELYEFVGKLTQTMWDAYEEGGISAMIAVGISEGIPYLLEFFEEALTLIPDDIPVISKIRDFAVWTLDWLEENADALVNTLDVILDIITLVGDNIKTVVTLLGFFIGFYIGSSMFKSIPLIGGLIGGGVGAVTGYAVMEALGYAEGGHPTVPQLAMVAEDEPEYIIPDSKMPAFLEANTQNIGGNTTSYTLNFYGYNEDQLVRKVEEVTSRNTTLASLRGGF